VSHASFPCRIAARTGTGTGTVPTRSVVT
jgi:hypothetical protein